MKCPKCGKSHYRELGGISTCVMWYPEYKDGKQVNNNPNTITMNYECCECGAKFHINNNGEPILDVIPEPVAEARPYITIDSDGIISGLDDSEICAAQLNRYRKCQICGKTFICGSSISGGIGPDTDKYLCDECAESLRVLIDLIPVIQENRSEIQALKDKLREKTKKDISFKE